jgi:ribonuclease VapC
MVIDSSAIVAILGNEPETERLSRAIALSGAPRLSAAAKVEIALVMASRRGPGGIEDMRRLLSRTQILVEPVTDRQAELAISALQVYGKGRHPAGLNFGDCLVYALAKDLGEPLLFKGTDFAKTDIEVAPY